MRQNGNGKDSRVFGIFHNVAGATYGDVREGMMDKRLEDWNANAALASEAADAAAGRIKQNYCYLCEMRHPCLCDFNNIAAKMRALYDKKHTVTANLFGSIKETWKTVPTDGRPDPMMRDLLDVAINEWVNLTTK